MTEHLRWPLEELWQSLAPRMPGFTAELLPSVDSTNSECMRRLSEGQAAGASLTFSLALPMAPRSWSGLSLAVGLSVADSLQAELPPTGSRTPRIALKWPNDLWLQGRGAERKLGGILVETASWLAPRDGPISPHRPTACMSLMRAGMHRPPWGVWWNPW